MWRRSTSKNKLWHSGHYRHIALLKKTHKQVKIRYSVCIYKTTRIHSKRILAVSPRDLAHGTRLISPIFETCVLNPFHGQKNQRKRFSDEKSRGPLLARAALYSVLSNFTRIHISIHWSLKPPYHAVDRRKLEAFFHFFSLLFFYFYSSSKPHWKLLLQPF